MDTEKLTANELQELRAMLAERSRDRLLGETCYQEAQRQRALTPEQYEAIGRMQKLADDMVERYCERFGGDPFSEAE